MEGQKLERKKENWGWKTKTKAGILGQKFGALRTNSWRRYEALIWQVKVTQNLHKSSQQKKTRRSKGGQVKERWRVGRQLVNMKLGNTS